MSTFERVKNAKSPQDAMLAIAHGIDHICTRLDQLEDKPADAGWGAWETPPAEEAPRESENGEDVKRRREHAAENIRALEQMLEEETDEEERRAIEARLSLARDQLAETLAIEAGPEPSASTVEVVDGKVTVNLPPADDIKQAKRREFAKAIQLEESLDGATCDDYGKGGPLWLYYGNRDFVITLPYEAMLEMVKDVFEDDPTEAAIMAADLLKDGEAEDHETVLNRLHGE